jgi:5'-3' exoribonuclease 1
MEYVRYLKAQKKFDPNTRHCLYGLDADLIMLGLCTHERHFSLLREEVKFGKKNSKAVSVSQQRFYLLHLSLLREYLEQEFIVLKQTLKIPFDIEKVRYLLIFAQIILLIFNHIDCCRLLMIGF